ncbi:flagellar hook-length control protein FliK [Alteromonas flava]|uniref:flagellar hook-length control protein FliK n=1 Tax=Alteromonas flava TaxID=2048003 RepID=UPI000C285C4F|nr:flagellar hook-length control protein FliK [Alteromonas flava]
MMQQIAPLQTDIAAKSEVSFDVEKQWLGSAFENNREQQQFGNMLSQERASQERTKSVVSAERPSQPERPSQSEGKTQRTDSRESNTGSQASSTSGKPENSDTNAKPSNEQKSNEVTQKPDSKETNETAHTEVARDKAAPEKTSKNQAAQADEATVEQAEFAEKSAAKEAINWVDWVEQVKAINNDGDGQTNWDGEIAEMHAVYDSDLRFEVTTSEAGEILLSVSIADTANENSELNIALDSIANDLIKLLQADSDKQQNIQNDLFIIPQEELNNGVLTGVELDNQTLTPSEQNLPQQLLAILLGDEDPANTPALESTIMAEHSETTTEPEVGLSTDAIAELFPELEAAEGNIAAKNNESTELPTFAASVTLVKNPSELLRDIANLSEEQQVKALDVLADALLRQAPTPVTPQQQQSYVTALQGMLEEYKQQLNQGREPGLSVKALLSEALAEAGLNNQEQLQVAANRVAEQVMQTLTAIDAAKRARGAAEDMLANVQRTDAPKVEGALQAEVQRNASTQAMLDKPVNITKAEGQNQFAEKIRWIVNARSSFAEIRLDPPELGSVKVRVNMNGEAAQVNFVVQSPQARDALDQAIPRLKDMLNQQGIELGQSFVQQDNQQQQGEQQGDFGQGQGDDAMEDIASEVIEQRVVNGSAGGIDYYA